MRMQTDENLYSCFNLTFLYIIIFLQRNEIFFSFKLQDKEAHNYLTQDLTLKNVWN